MSWSEFWSGVGNWFATLFQSIGNWFVASEEGELNNLARLLIALVILVIGNLLIKLIIRLIRKATGIKNALSVDVSVKSFVVAVINVILRTLLVIGVLMILNVQFDSVATILSAFTVAIGLSLQDLISAFASGVVLLSAKNFKSGDYIEIVHDCGKCEGTVRSVGLLTTSLDTVNGQRIIVPNNKTLQGVVTNYSTNPTRRLVIDINIDYRCDIREVKKVILGTIENYRLNEQVVITKNPLPQVVVTDITDFSFVASVRVYVMNDIYWDVNFGLREAILIALKDNGIQIPYRRIAIEQASSGDNDTH